jgi:hypothetical protein
MMLCCSLISQSKDISGPGSLSPVSPSPMQTIRCPHHLSLFQPHSFQYTQEINLLKLSPGLLNESLFASQFTP